MLQTPQAQKRGNQTNTPKSAPPFKKAKADDDTTEV